MSKLTLFKIYWKARPFIKKIEEQSKMKLSTSSIVQILLSLIQIANIAEPYTSGKLKAGVAAVLIIIQTILHILTGNTNPDGTSAKTAYIKYDYSSLTGSVSGQPRDDVKPIDKITITEPIDPPKR